MDANDTVNGQPAILGDTVTITTVNDPDDNDDVTLDPTTGIVTVGPDAIAGEYEIEYTICSTINTESCSTTTVTVVVPGNAEILTEDSVAVFNGISPNGLRLVKYH